VIFANFIFFYYLQLQEKEYRSKGKNRWWGRIEK